MANKMSIRSINKVEKEREMKVFKADELLQKARFSLSLTEQRLILYAITKIKPCYRTFPFFAMFVCDCYPPYLRL